MLIVRAADLAVRRGCKSSMSEPDDGCSDEPHARVFEKPPTHELMWTRGPMQLPEIVQESMTTGVGGSMPHYGESSITQ